MITDIIGETLEHCENDSWFCSFQNPWQFIWAFWLCRINKYNTHTLSVQNAFIFAFAGKKSKKSRSPNDPFSKICTNKLYIFHLYTYIDDCDIYNNRKRERLVQKLEARLCTDAVSYIYIIRGKWEVILW